MDREVIEEFLALFPIIDTNQDTYRCVLQELTVYGDQLDSCRAANWLRFTSKSEWGLSQRYSAQHISEWIAICLAALGAEAVFLSLHSMPSVAAATFCGLLWPASARKRHGGRCE